MKITREQFMLAHAIAGCVNTTNPPFTAYDNQREATNEDPMYVENVAEMVASLINYDKMAVDDLQDVLTEVIQICNKKQ